MKEKDWVIIIGNKPIQFYNFIIDKALRVHNEIVIKVMDINDPEAEQIINEKAFDEFFDKIERDKIKVCNGCKLLVEYLKKLLFFTSIDETRQIPIIYNRIDRVDYILNSKKDIGYIEEVSRVEKMETVMDINKNKMERIYLEIRIQKIPSLQRMY